MVMLPWNTGSSAMQYDWKVSLKSITESMVGMYGWIIR